jgi:hypothetical protein
MIETILISLIGGIAGGAGYVHLRPYVLAYFRKPENRNAGVERYQAFKDGK